MRKNLLLIPLLVPCQLRADDAHALGDALAAEANILAPAFVVQNVEVEPEQCIHQGQWGSVINWTPHIPVSAANLPDGRILTFASNQRTTFPSGVEFTYAATWNPANGQFQEFNHPSHDMFCGGLVMLDDGRVLVTGGTNRTNRASVFDWRTNTWTRVANMNDGRWYNTMVAVRDGAWTATGSGTGTNTTERWNGTAWTRLSGIPWNNVFTDAGYIKEWHPFLTLAPDGRIFHFGPTDTMHWVNIDGNGSLTNSGQFVPGTHYPKEGCWVMYDEGKILVAGGGANTTNNPSDTTTGTSTKSAYTVDLTTNPPTIAATASMANARQFANAVVLPSGEVLVMGGNTSGLKFNDTGSVLPCEIWSPITRTWRTVASIGVPRNYHSLALLLPDGRVMSGGGGLSGNSADHRDAQLYTPPCLFTPTGAPATRPVLNTAPTVIGAGQTFTVTGTPGLAKFAFIKMSALTHSVNTDLRYLKLPFTETSSGTYQITARSNLNVMTPGYWMLFGISPSAPYSVAKVIRVDPTAGITITNPGSRTTNTGTPVSLQLTATGPVGTTISWSATGLPAGLTVSTSGLISGTPTASGIYNVRLTASGGAYTSSADLVWTVLLANPGSGSILREWWLGIAGSTLADLTGNAAYPNSPTGSDQRTSFETPTDWADNLGQRLRGRVHPPVTGQYRFWIAGDDESRLLVSTDTGSANASIVCRVPTWTSPRAWTTFPEQQSALITLQAGQSYYIEALMKEGGGGDNLAVAWQIPGSSSIEVISGAYLSPFQPNRAPVLTNPGNRTWVTGSPVLLDVTATDADGDPLTFSASGLPAGLTIQPTSGRISGSPTAAGSFNTTVSVTDGRSAAVSTSFTWTINAPVNVTLPGAAPAASGSSRTFTASATGGVNVQYQWNFGDGSQTGFSSAATASHTYAAPGRYLVTVTVKDDTGRTVSTSFTQAIHAPLTARKPTASTSILFEDRTSGNDRIWCVNPDNDSVTVFDAVTRAKVAEVNVGSAPRSIAVAPDGRIWVVNTGSATLSILNSATPAVTATVALPRASRPFGLAFDPDGSDAWVACETTGRLLRLNPASGAQTGSLDLGPNIRHVSVTADSSRVLVSRFITPPLPGEATANIITESGSTRFGGEVISVLTGTLAVERTSILQHSTAADTPVSARGIPNYLGPAVISPDGLSARIASKQDNVKRGSLRDGSELTHDLAMRSIVSRLPLGPAPAVTDDLAARVDHDNAGIPSTAAFDPAGVYFFTAIEGSREVAVTDAWANDELLRIEVGRAPQGLALSPDGRTLYTHNFMDRTVSVHSIAPVMDGLETPPSLVATLNCTTTERLSATVLKGKQLFYDARDPRISLQQYISCAACHNDGAQDGRTWDFTQFGEGLRNTITLRGHGGTSQGPLHWSGNFDEVQDFENQIRGLAGGTGLIAAGSPHAPMSTANAGRSADLDALAAYVASLATEDPSPHRNADGSLTAAAAAGRQVFQVNGCAQCHSGQHYTNSALNVFRNVGTLKPSSGQRLGQPLTGLDVPGLRGVWNTGPWLHDGSAATLADAVTAHQGITLSGASLTNLAAFLRELDGDLPSAGSTPSVVLSGPVSASGAFTVTATFSGPVTGVSASDFLVSNGTGSALTQVSSTVWTLTVTPLNTGIVVVRTLQNAAQSTDGNASLASNVLSVTYEGIPVVPADDWWKLDDTAGTSAANAASDRNGTHQNGVLINQPGARTGTAGAARYDGIDDQTQLPALNYPGDAMTIALWVRRDGVQNALAQLLFCSSSQTDAGIGLSAGGHGLRYHWAGTHWDFAGSPELVLPDNQWCLVALVVQPDRGTMYLRTAAGLQSAVNIAPHTAQAFEAASYLAVDSRRPARRFRGWLDDVRLFRSALSGTEIDALYQAASAGSTNRAPVVTQPANQTNDRGSVVSLQIAGTDPDGSSLSWSASGLPAGLTIGSSTGLISGTISASAAASNAVTVTAGDGTLTGSASFTWTTTAPGTTLPVADDHWRLDETSGLSALNAVRTLDGAHQNGALAGQPGATSGLGRSAYYDGTDDLTRVPPPGYAGANLTLTAWIRRNGAQNPWAQFLCSFGQDVDVAFGFGTANELRYRWEGSHYDFAPSPALSVPDNQWVFAALAVEPAGATLYLRTAAGMQSARNTAPHLAQVFSSDLALGTDTSRTGRTFKGWLDDVRIFRRTLTVSDVDALWNSAQSGSANRAPVVSRPADQSTPRASTASLQILASDPDGNTLAYSATGLPAGLTINSTTGLISGTVGSTAAAANSVTVTVSDGPLSTSTSFPWAVTATAGLTPPDDWWKLDETSGTTAANSVRTLPGTHLGGALVNQPGAFPTSGSSVYYDGTDDATSIPPLGNSSTSMSVLVWLKRDGVQAPRAQFFFCRDGSTDAGFGLGDNHALQYHWQGDYWDFAPAPAMILPDNQWCLAALVIRPDSGTLLLRTPQGLQSSTNFAPHFLQEFASVSNIASDPSRDGRRFKGWVDDTRLYRKALTLDEVEAVWLAGVGGNRSSGLTGSYFSGVNFDTMQLQRLDADINFNWTTGSPAAGIPADNFSVRWTGCVIPQFTQVHTFHLLASTGCRMWVNDQLIIDNWTSPVSTEVTGTAALTAGAPVPVRVEYYHTTGTARCELSWSASGLPKQIIPQSRLLMNETSLGGIPLAISGVPDAWTTPASALLALDALPDVQSTMALRPGDAGTLTLDFSRLAGMPEQWRLEASTDLKSWQTVPASRYTVSPGDALTERILLPDATRVLSPQQPRQTFFRVRAGR